MIHDTFDCIGLYTQCGLKLSQAVEFARTLPADTPNGRIEIDGEAMFAVVSSYTTKSPDQLTFEAHRKYIDVQVLLSGRERIDVTRQSDLPILQPYAEDTDVMFYDTPPAYSSLFLQPGEFVVLYPHDAHRPCLTAGAPADVRKLVIKIRV